MPPCKHKLLLVWLLLKLFQIYVVVRCIDVDNKEDVELAKNCIESMYAAQAKIDAARIEEVNFCQFY